MDNKDRFNLIAAYITIIAIVGKLLLIFAEVSFGKMLEVSHIFEKANDVYDVFPVVFNVLLLFCFGFVILRYYSGKNAECTLEDLQSVSKNIAPLENKVRNINLTRINLIVKEYMNYTLYFIAILLVYYGVTFSFEYLILPKNYEYSTTNYIITKLLASAKIAINDGANLISCLPLFICFRLLFYKSFKNDDEESSNLNSEKRLFTYLGALIILISFIEFCFLASLKTTIDDGYPIIAGPYEYKKLNDLMVTSPVIFVYKSCIGLLAALSLGLLTSRILAMDFLYDFNIDNKKIVNAFLNFMIKLLPLYPAVQPFYALFTYEKPITPHLEYIVSFTYFVSGIGKLVYLLFIVYLCNSKEFHKYIYLTAALKDVKKYNVFIERN